MAENTTRRDFLKASAGAGFTATGLSTLLSNESQARPPNIPRPHFHYSFTPFGNFSHMHWGPFVVTRPAPFQNIAIPHTHGIPNRVRTYNGNTRRVEWVNPRQFPQGIIANGWSDRDRDGGSSLEEYVGLNKPCFGSDENFRYGIHRIKGCFTGDSYDVRVFGPKNNLAGRNTGRFDQVNNAWESLNLDNLVKDRDHGEGNYCVEYLINGNIKERRQFRLVDRAQARPGIPNGRTPQQLGIDRDSDGSDMFIARGYTDSNNNGRADLGELYGVNPKNFSVDDHIVFGFYNGVSMEGQTGLTVIRQDGSTYHSKPQNVDGMITHWTASPGAFKPGKHRFSMNPKGKSTLFGQEFNGGSYIPQEFEVTN